MAKLNMHLTDKHKGFEQYQFIIKRKDKIAIHGYVRFSLRATIKKKWQAHLFMVSSKLNSLGFRTINNSDAYTTLKANKSYFKDYMETVYG